MMRNSKNNLISYGLSLLLLNSILDLNHHHENEYPNGYNIVDSSSENHDPHAHSYQCVKCLTKVQRSTENNSFNFSFQKIDLALYLHKNIIYEKLINFDLNSRPPPFIL